MRRPNRFAIALLGVVVLLLVLIVGSALVVRVQIRERDAALADAATTIGSLQDELSRRNQERDELIVSSDALRQERDGLAGQRDVLAAARETLTTRVADLEQRDSEAQRRTFDLEARLADAGARTSALEKRLSDSDAQLQQALERANRTPTPAAVQATPTPTARAESAARTAAASEDLKRLIELDDQLYAEFQVLLGHISAVSDAFVQGNYLRIQSAYQQGTQSADRMKDLFARRNAVLDRLR